MTRSHRSSLTADLIFGHQTANTVTIPSGKTLSVLGTLTAAASTLTALTTVGNHVVGAGTHSIALTDNVATVFQIKEATNNYLKIDTTDSSELITLGVNTTVDTGKTLAITTADKLTVGGVIVPVNEDMSFTIPLVAGIVVYDWFVAPRAYTVVGVTYFPTTLQGGAMTITPVKATGTNLAAAATTPLVSAGFNGNTGLRTLQTGSLTATGADLVLAAGDRLSCVLSTASTVHQGVVTFLLKRS